MDLTDVPKFLIVEDYKCLQACLEPLTSAQKRACKRLQSSCDVRTVLKINAQQRLEPRGPQPHQRAVIVKGVKYPSARQASLALGVSDTTIARWAGQGKAKWA